MKLCTFALEMIPNYKAVIDETFDLLRPGGKSLHRDEDRLSHAQ